MFGKDGEESRFRWVVSKKLFLFDKMCEVGVSLLKAYVDVVVDDLRWDEIYWGLNLVIICDKEY